jgi:uncharacterized protein (DUF1697 family)
MTVFIALLRAVNVGGTGKLPMATLKALCEKAGCRKVQTYIASGNVVFENARSEAAIKTALEMHLAEYAGKPVRVLVRTRTEMAAVLEANPFTKTAPNRAPSRSSSMRHLPPMRSKAPPAAATRRSRSACGKSTCITEMGWRARN